MAMLGYPEESYAVIGSISKCESWKYSKVQQFQLQLVLIGIAKHVEDYEKFCLFCRNLVFDEKSNVAVYQLPALLFPKFAIK